ncbi:MAG: hypothetical protein NE330_04620 [Lentisphaeraceae bacterium]|nr:hypothetical protein [Lentisphaeraceae bacterium]
MTPVKKDLKRYALYSYIISPLWLLSTASLLGKPKLLDFIFFIFLTYIFVAAIYRAFKSYQAFKAGKICNMQEAKLKLPTFNKALSPGMFKFAIAAATCFYILAIVFTIIEFNDKR